MTVQVCVCFLAELLDIELNHNLQQAVDSMQMPRVEYREIDVDDYGS